MPCQAIGWIFGYGNESAIISVSIAASRGAAAERAGVAPTRCVRKRGHPRRGSRTGTWRWCVCTRCCNAVSIGGAIGGAIGVAYISIYSYLFFAERDLQQLLVGEIILRVRSVLWIHKKDVPRRPDPSVRFPDRREGRADEIGSEPRVFSVDLEARTEGRGFVDAHEAVGRSDHAQALVVQVVEEGLVVSDVRVVGRTYPKVFAVVAAFENVEQVHYGRDAAHEKPVVLVAARGTSLLRGRHHFFALEPGQEQATHVAHKAIAVWVDVDQFRGGLPQRVHSEIEVILIRNVFAAPGSLAVKTPFRPFPDRVDSLLDVPLDVFLARDSTARVFFVPAVVLRSGLAPIRNRRCSPC
mmetsp:Transcript_1122/g.2808  ORF Transcript_1122/g.2808 Transcript_1122/m.2808 type:complete len:354 (-) Transcript_1122:676-1737(-)